MHSCPICQKEFNSTEALEQHKKQAHPHAKAQSSNGKAIIIGVIALIAIGIILMSSGAFSSSKYDSLAQCIDQSGAKFYGAFWCPHCTAQKELFGSSAKYLPYIECSTPDKQGQLPVCSSVGINGYPTWIFSDGTRTGPLTIQELSQKTGCAIESS